MWDTLVLPFVPVGANSSGRWSSRPVLYTHADSSPRRPRGSSTMTTGSPLAAATSAPAASVTTATAPFSAAVGGELGAVAVHAADGDEHVARAQIGGRERQARERHAGGVAADLDAESGGEVVERMDGGRVRAEHGGQVRGRVSRHGASILSSSARRPPSLGQLKAAGGYGVPCGSDRVRHRCRAPGRGARRVDRPPRTRPPVARQEVRCARRAVHDRLRTDPLVAAPG